MNLFMNYYKTPVFLLFLSMSITLINAQGEVAYRINSRLKIVLLSQFTERSDLTWRYGDEVIRFSGFMGIEFSI